MHVARFDLLIDGYNLMHAAGFAREQYGPRDLQRQRERFVRWVWRRIPPPLRPRTVIVFDAGQSDGTYVQQESFEDLRLLYSPRGTEADDLIEELIELHSAPKQLQVVSSDHRLHKAARRRKATALDSEAFVSLMLRIAREARERQRELEEESKPSGEFPEETAEWLRVFSDVDDWMSEVEPLPQPSPPNKPAGTPTAPAPPPIANPPAEANVDIPSAELAFWEERLRDLLSPKR